jgi:hypothetical protein
MTTWNNLMSYIDGKYKVNDRSPDQLSMIFNLENGRTQIVLVNQETAAGANWVTISSAIGKVGQVDMARAGTLLFEYVTGGLVCLGDLVLVRHAMRLADLSTEEFELPLRAVVRAADDLEQKLTGTDAF